ncbi:MAG: S24 family peptidase [Verrucomicrobiota bacterium]|nr:S24 family peptidase [Verrucomicrobiota bacterium]
METPNTSTEKVDFGEPEYKYDATPLRRARKALRLTQLELAKMLDIHRTYLVLIETGVKIPSPRLQKNIEEFIRKAAQETAGRRPFTMSDPGFISGGFRPAGPMARQVPVVSWATAGAAKDYEDLCNQLDEVVTTETKDPNAFAIIIEGDSMEPKFNAGDRIVFTPNQEPRNSDPVLVKMTDGRVFFKYFYRTGPEGSRIKLVSENPAYSPIEVDRSEVTLIYPAFELKRRLRR